MEGLNIMIQYIRFRYRYGFKQFLDEWFGTRFSLLSSSYKTEQIEMAIHGQGFGLWLSIILANDRRRYTCIVSFFGTFLSHRLKTGPNLVRCHGLADRGLFY